MVFTSTNRITLLKQLKLRCYGSKYVVKYPRCSLRRHSTYSDAEVILFQSRILYRYIQVDYTTYCSFDKLDGKSPVLPVKHYKQLQMISDYMLVGHHPESENNQSAATVSYLQTFLCFLASQYLIVCVYIYIHSM